MNSERLGASVGTRVPVEYLPRVWQSDEGLPDNRIQAIAQTPEGFLWVGTHEGLARFDGLDFTTFDSTNTSRINTASITALCTAPDGTLWIGTELGSILRMREGVFSRINQFDDLAGRRIHSIAIGHDEAIWIGSARRLSRFKNGRVDDYTTDQGLLANNVTALLEDSTTNLWIGTTRGLNLLRAGQIEAFPLIGDIANDRVDSLWQDRSGRLWIACEHGLVWAQQAGAGVNEPPHAMPGERVYTDHSVRFHVQVGPDGLAYRRVSSVLEDRQDNLWVGAHSGLSRFTGGHLRTEYTRSGMTYDRVNKLFEDSWGDIWAGSREGLIRLTPKLFSVYTQRQGLGHNNVTSILEDHLGRLWVGTYGGLSVITEGRVRKVGGTNQLGSNLISALCEDRAGGIWVGTESGGRLCYLKDGEVTRYDSRAGLPEAGVSVLHQDSSGQLWIGTWDGLCRLTGDQVVTEPAAAGQRMRAICEDRAGVLWFGGAAGLICRRDGTFENLTTTGRFPRVIVSSLCVDSDGKTLWVGTAAGGLVRWRDNRYDRYTVEEGLLSNEIVGIVEDRGWLWMGSSKGVFRVRKQDLERPGAEVPCVTYGAADGLESVACTGAATPSVWKTVDGRLCFATAKGLAIINARNASLKLSAPRVLVEGFELDRKPMSLPAAGELLVPPSRGELQFRYTALDLRAGEKCRFKYKLEGLDRDWVDAGKRRVAHYSGVPPGKYQFRVIACNKDGVWNELGATVSLQLRPHVWETWWFQALCGACVIGSVAALVRANTKRRMQRRLERLKLQHSLEQERGRIARNIHDDLGSSLTRIMLLGTRAEQDLAEKKEVHPHLRKIVDFSRATVQSMDEIVWAVNPKHDTLDGLVGYLTQFSEQFFEDSGIRCRLEMPVSAEAFALPAEVRHDLFLVVKEALNNVLKHSGASEVRLEVSLQGDRVQIVVEDNGRGFDTSAAFAARKRNGLENMRRRMEGNGGTFEVASGSDRGTRIILDQRVKQHASGNN